jgi:hypothetical protein
MDSFAVVPKKASPSLREVAMRAAHLAVRPSCYAVAAQIRPYRFAILMLAMALFEYHFYKKASSSRSKHEGADPTCFGDREARRPRGGAKKTPRSCEGQGFAGLIMRPGSGSASANRDTPLGKCEVEEGGRKHGREWLEIEGDACAEASHSTGGRQGCSVTHGSSTLTVGSSSHEMSGQSESGPDHDDSFQMDCWNGEDYFEEDDYGQFVDLDTDSDTDEENFRGRMPSFD